MYTLFVLPIVFAIVYGMERFPQSLTKQKSDILEKKPRGELNYLYSIGEDENKTLDEEMWEAISHVKRFEFERIRTKNWQCKKVKKIYETFCKEWKKRWTSLTNYLDFYREFGRHKMGTKIEKNLRREKGAMEENSFKVKMAERIAQTGMLDHLAIKPHFKRNAADGQMLTFTEAISQCFSAYKALFLSQKLKLCQIYQCFCGIGGPNEAQIRPSSEFVNEKECVFVNEWVRTFKRAKRLGDNEPRMGAQILLSSIVPQIEKDEQIGEETLKMKPFQFPMPFN